MASADRSPFAGIKVLDATRVLAGPCAVLRSLGYAAEDIAAMRATAAIS